MNNNQGESRPPAQNGVHFSGVGRVNGNSSGSDRLGRQHSRRTWSWLAGLLMLLAVLLAPGREASAGSGVAGGSLQEVAPPAAVRQLQQALAERAPSLQILEPADDSLMPDGPWTLRLRVDDWPLVDAGPLGLGPHLVVQLDGEPPLRLTSLETSMPALRPGSHRLTVFAARPWGEAVKNPGAVRQIRLHRLVANPASLPARGTPQLIAVSPSLPSPAEPLLLDWLLIDAPLQNFRSGDTGWRLRVTVNGDSFLVDRQTPLWLKGWRPGLNALQLELLDGRGEPLNLPFNSLVSAVDLDRGVSAPAWRGGPLPPLALAQMLGEAPIATEASAPSATEPPPGSEATTSTTSPAPAPAADEPLTAPQEPVPAVMAMPSELEPPAPPAAATEAHAAQEQPTTSQPETGKEAAAARLDTEQHPLPEQDVLPPDDDTMSQVAPMFPDRDAESPGLEPSGLDQDRLPPEPLKPQPDLKPQLDTLPKATADSLPKATDGTVPKGTDGTEPKATTDSLPAGMTTPIPSPETATAPVDEPPSPAELATTDAADEAATAASQAEQATADELAPEQQPPGGSAADHPSEATTAFPPARALVNPDGTLIQTEQPSVLSALRRRFGR